MALVMKQVRNVYDVLAVYYCNMLNGFISLTVVQWNL